MWEKLSVRVIVSLILLALVIFPLVFLFFFNESKADDVQKKPTQMIILMQEPLTGKAVNFKDGAYIVTDSGVYRLESIDSWSSEFVDKSIEVRRPKIKIIEDQQSSPQRTSDGIPLQIRTEEPVSVMIIVENDGYRILSREE